MTDTKESRESGTISRGGASFDSRRLHSPTSEITTVSVDPGADHGPGATTVPRRCIQCGADLSRRDPRAKYCGWSCRHAGKATLRQARRARRVPAVCVGCGAEFQALARLVQQGQGKYCSVKCCAAHFKATGVFKGENNPRWLGGVSRDNMRYRTRQMEKWPERERARRLVQNALRLGKMERQPCEVCNDPKAQAHHDDYSKPLDVRWLCRPHHDAHHAVNGRGHGMGQP